jgi:hypothetical protein
MKETNKERDQLVNSVCRILIERRGSTSSVVNFTRLNSESFGWSTGVASLLNHEAAHQVVEAALLAAAIKGSVRAQIFYLTNRDPERWKTLNRLELSNTDDPAAFVELLSAQLQAMHQVFEGGSSDDVLAPNK